MTLNFDKHKHIAVVASLHVALVHAFSLLSFYVS